MTKPTWVLEKPVVSHERFGLPVSTEGAFISTRQEVPNDVLHKACVVLDAFYVFIDQYEIKVEEDSEQEVVVIDLMNGFVITIKYLDKNKAELLDRQGSVGSLKRKV